MSSKTQQLGDCQPPYTTNFQLAASMDPDSFAGTLSKGRQTIPHLKFDLLNSMSRNKSQYKRDTQLERDLERISRAPEPISLVCELKVELPMWLKSDVERQLAQTGYHRQDAIIACCEPALNRLLCHHSIYDSWEKLTKAAMSTDQHYPETEDFTELNALKSNWWISIPDISNAGKSKRGTVRFPFKLHDRLNATAETLGMYLPHLCNLLVIDGIRSQSGVVYLSQMDAIIEDFYFQLSRRLRRLYSNLKFNWDIELSEEVKGVLELIEERGIVC